MLADSISHPLDEAMLTGAQAPRASLAGKSGLVIQQANDALMTGNAAEAEWTLRRRLLEEPADAAVLAKLTEIVLARGQVEEATVLLRRAVAADPAIERRMALIRHLQKYVGANEVLHEINALPLEIRSSAEVLELEAAMSGFLGDQDRQIAIYEKLVAEDDKNSAVWLALGDALRMVGRIDEAAAAVRKAIAARPTFGEAWWTLASFKSYRFAGKDVSAMRKALRGKLVDGDALNFHFALGKALEDRGEFAKSFRHYEVGNAICRKGIAPAQTRVTDHVDRSIAAFTAELFGRNRGGGCSKPDPIFVVGLHRSGSTLIEQILAGHPLIEATNELTSMHILWQRIARLADRAGRSPFEELVRLGPSDFAAIGEEYLERAKPFRLAGTPSFIDKQPANWMFVGLILLALPKAKIIDARRHPMATGFANFKQHYASGMNFSHSLESIGTFYRDYWRFMSHVEAVQPGKVHRIINENLIEDPEGEVRRLLKFIGVPFDPACLQLQDSERTIRTPSAEQVRRGISREGVDQWRNYEAWLGPLRKALGDALDNWDKA
jgi:tetratricopeptide (TPR) repeat protein